MILHYIQHYKVQCSTDTKTKNFFLTDTQNTIIHNKYYHYP